MEGVQALEGDEEEGQEGHLLQCLSLLPIRVAGVGDHQVSVLGRVSLFVVKIG